MLTNVRVIPSRANRIRAAAAAHPQARPLELAQLAGVRVAEVDIALSRARVRRVKSVAPRG